MSGGLLFFLIFGVQDCYTIAFNSRFRYRNFRFWEFDDYGYPLIWIEFYGLELRNSGVWLEEPPF